ncbi:MAG: hypothetical protein ACJAYU_003805 [Bradymonadia bacterium]
MTHCRPERSFISLPVAVIVGAVTNLVRGIALGSVADRGAGGGVEIAADDPCTLTKPGASETDVAHRVPLIFIDIAVAVVVDAVTDFRSCVAGLSATDKVSESIAWIADEDARTTTSAVSVEANSPDVVPLRFLVGISVAVIVESVADFFRGVAGDCSANGWLGGVVWVADADAGSLADAVSCDAGLS